MIRLFQLLLAWLRRPDERMPAARLSDAQVMELAQAAVAAMPRPPRLTNAGRRLRDGRVVWTVAETARGSSMVVEIDDETGTVISVGRVGLR